MKRLPAGPPDRLAGGDGPRPERRRGGAQGDATGAYLQRLGIDVDLAPVLDTPASPSSFLGSRAFSGDPQLNAALGTAFVEGPAARRRGGDRKALPGARHGAPSRPTRTTCCSTTAAPALERRLVPFARAIDAGVKVVMVSNAGYTAYDPTGVPAVISRPIVTGLLRDRLGFRGVVISDAMEAPGPSGRPRAAVSAIAAGVDILLYAASASSAAGYAGSPPFPPPPPPPPSMGSDCNDNCRTARHSAAEARIEVRHQDVLPHHAARIRTGTDCPRPGRKGRTPLSGCPGM